MTRAPGTGCRRSICCSKASAGGQLEQPSEVNSSASTGTRSWEWRTVESVKSAKMRRIVCFRGLLQARFASRAVSTRQARVPTPQRTFDFRRAESYAPACFHVVDYEDEDAGGFTGMGAVVRRSGVRFRTEAGRLGARALALVRRSVLRVIGRNARQLPSAQHLAGP